ncbi:MAG: hypothetical protein EBU93_07255 [Chlamydiae bacterium]|nr:hypothetical protein [Chlamydiota bacterium]
MIKQILFFFLSLCFVAFGHPAWMPFLGPFAGALGYGLFWRSLDSVPLSKSRFWVATFWFFLAQLVQMSWVPSVKYQGFYIVWVYLFVSVWVEILQQNETIYGTAIGRTYYLIRLSPNHNASLSLFIILSRMSAGFSK